VNRARKVGDSLLSRERPTQREFILRAQYIPDVVSLRGVYFWDGQTARRPDGRSVILTDDECAAQLLIMAKRGTWGDLSDVILDWNRHAMIREALDRNGSRASSEIGEWRPNS
jgi:hypothetical protein